MPAELGRELSDRAFEEMRKTMRPGNPSIPVAACWVTSLLTMPWKRLDSLFESRAEEADFRFVELREERSFGLIWKGYLGAPGVRMAQLRAPRDCMIRGFSLQTFGIAPEDCRITLTLPNRRELFNAEPHRLVTLEGQGLSLPWPSAIPIQAGEPIVAELEVRGNARKTGAAILRISYRSDHQLGAFSVRPFSIAIEGECDGNSWDLPPGRSERRREISPAVNGRLVAIGAQLGPFATEVWLEDLDSGERFWHQRPPLDRLLEKGETRPEWFVAGRRMFPGHRYGLRVAYDNPEIFTLPHAGTAVFRGLFRPARKGEWPLL